MEEEIIKILEEKINKDYKDMMAVINSTSLPLFVEDTIEDMHILIEHLIARNKELEVINKMQEYRINVIDEREFIPKSKVREKIEECEKEIEVHSLYEEMWERIKVLQELLEES